MGTRKLRPKNRHDTFDLSKKCVLVSTAKRLEELSVFIDEDPPPEEDTNPDYVTPRAGTEVNIDAMAKEMARTLDNDLSGGG